MFEFHEKRKLKSILYSRPFLVFMCIPVGLMLFAALNAHTKVEETSEKRAELVAELGVLEERARGLESDIAKLDDPRGIESELRSRYEVGWEGEEVIVLVEEEEETSTRTTPVQEEKGFLGRFFDIFF